MLEVIGHRGCRGLRPENSLPAVSHALQLGADAVELDVGVTVDDIVVVHHDYRLNPAFTRDRSLQWVAKSAPLLKDLTFAELREYDIGRLNPMSIYAARFRRQTAIDGTRIPSLEEVAQLASTLPSEKTLYVEAKRSAAHPELTHDCDRFADAIAEELRRLSISSRTIVESFDWNVLKRIQQRYPEIQTSPITSLHSSYSNVSNASQGAWTLGHLLSECGGSLPRLVQKCGAVSTWCSSYQDLNRQLVDEAHDLGLRVFAWTVNDAADMRRMINFGVDGIVTDYPDRLLRLVGAGS